jgi:hypothetical protein
MISSSTTLLLHALVELTTRNNLDNSGSMREENRWPKQTELATRIANIVTSIPGNKGVYFRFINKATADADNLDSNSVSSRLRANAPNGSTPIGTQLREKILKPLVYSVLDAGKQLKHAYLIMIITDGCPWDEPNDQLRVSILECGKRLKDAGYRSDGKQAQASTADAMRSHV